MWYGLWQVFSLLSQKKSQPHQLQLLSSWNQDPLISENREMVEEAFFWCYVQWPLPAADSDISIYLAFPWELSTPTRICHTESLVPCSWHSHNLPPTLGILGLCSLQVFSWLQTSANMEQHFKLFEQLWHEAKMSDKMLYVGVCLRSVMWRQTQEHVAVFLKVRR